MSARDVSIGKRMIACTKRYSRTVNNVFVEEKYDSVKDMLNTFKLGY